MSSTNNPRYEPLQGIRSGWGGFRDHAWHHGFHVGVTHVIEGKGWCDREADPGLIAINSREASVDGYIAGRHSAEHRRFRIVYLPEPISAKNEETPE